eukprot:CAMPEP_0114421386 /NCGR_PEP_ID=MMETSP0103-20121206/5050_1 /TAXON_ID=37642 ORGANISM="Paraphysomonas imperforata, Strain PA2" /NCGR_SAMPLE_ID=MMETSP0103 /ASSEMBLY_ACC=CAM_ASM_000201 /LENGTH=78 /DNA_ID=CAMNT_0001589903 /DNA_START=379 /DNA_END=615 /DNA_ORIENTATION=+
MKKYHLWSLSYQGDIVESELVDDDRDQGLTLFYTPSTVRQTEAAEMDRRVRSATLTGGVANPLPSLQEDEGDDVDKHL